MLLLLPLLLPFVSVQDPGPGEPVEWDRDVRPILSQHCFPCHGPDAAAREARLRLDRREVLEDPRGIVVPGEASASELMRRVLAPDRDERMPPPELGKDLSPAKIELLRRWLDQGAVYQDHWAFRPVQDPAPPGSPGAPGLAPIDAFVLAGLERRGLELSPEADRRTLIRRVSCDLTGLPPTPAQLEQYLGDQNPDAYERLVERLLASDAYAERMTLAWMDAARYGDTHVLHADGPRDMWPWRDWVLSAYRDNMPFDRFTLWQMAGDLLPDATLEQRVATGFHRNNGTSDEDGAIDEELRVAYAIDRVKTTANVWLGISLECAQCHDHKYDPVDARDYYRFYAFFNQADELGVTPRDGNSAPVVSVPTAELTDLQRAVQRELRDAQQRLDATRAPERELTVWMAEARRELLALQQPVLSPWSRLGPVPAPAGGDPFRRSWGPENVRDPRDYSDDDHSWAQDDQPGGDRTTISGAGAGRANYLFRTATLAKGARRTAFVASDGALKIWLNGVAVLARGEAGEGQVTLDLRSGENLLLFKVVPGVQGSFLRLTVQGSTLPVDIAAALRAPAAERDDAQLAALAEHFKRQVWRPGVLMQEDLVHTRVRFERNAQTSITSMVMADLPGGRPTYVLDRGRYDGPLLDQPVQPGVLETLLPMPAGAPANRLGLARWLTDPAHPLTARVAVNRYWAMLFGRGLVTTVMDFGSQGDYPSHPRLLDWLAHDFVESGWDVKRALRQMVTSRTYRQSSKRRGRLDELDPQNELLGRAPRYRLQAEFIRDQALVASGLLVERFGGPGVRPYQPDGLWNEVSFEGKLRYVHYVGDALYRRSMYTYWKRAAPAPAMTLFDAPSRERCVVQRQRTNTPLQALVVMNDTGFVEAARHLAERMLAAGATFEQRLDEGFLRCTARPADEGRREVMRALYRATLAEFRADPDRAAALLAVGDAPRDQDLDLAEHAAWTVLASLILNLDETLTRE